MVFLKDKVVFKLLVAFLVFGVAYRLFPVIGGQPNLAQFFVTEDGYLMLTIARNMAIGLGMSVSEGTVPSNGVQPLATFLFSVPYFLTGGDKVTSLAGVQLIATAISIAGIFSIRALAQDIFKLQNTHNLWPWLAATLWFTSPILLLHTMNALETGLYAVAVTATLVLFGRLLAKKDSATLKDRLLLGVFCGFTFLARNDGAFLITAIFSVWVLHDLVLLRHSIVKVITQLFPPGLVSVIMAAPWLINNYVNFGSIVPISGTAQSHSASFGQNAGLLPAKLFEFAFPMLPVPESFEQNPAFFALAIIVLGAILLAFLIGVWQRGGPARFVVAAYVLYAAALGFYYGFEFGAPWFLSRYLSPVAPLLIIATISVAIDLLTRISPKHASAVVSVVGLAGLVVSVVLLGRFMIPGAKAQGHFQVVDWVEQNVPDTAWVGAVQTGTLGYWHDRTVNLDGKVNPAALQALLEEGNVLNYVLGSQIEYIADWSGVAAWTTTGNLGNTEFSESFEMLVQDDARNLGVLKRR